MVAARRRLRSEGGFTMILVLGVLVVTALLSAAVFTAVGGDVSLTRADLDGKRAYAAAQAGLQAYLYGLNNNSSTSAWWETCSNDSTSGLVTVPGSSTGVYYSYQPVKTCLQSNPVGTLIDPTTGALRIEFTGKSGTGCATGGQPCESRTIVAGFRTLSPLSFLWYTVYETQDTAIAGANSGCNQYYYNDPSLVNDSNCVIYWGPDDKMLGPMYTQDQFLILSGAHPQWGRTKADQIASEVPTGGQNDICVNSNCQNDPNIVGTPEPNVTPHVPMPPNNVNLLTDATNHGTVYTGTVTLTLSVNAQGTTVANGAYCTSATNCTAITNLAITPQNPIIYAKSASGCVQGYTPTNLTYQTNSSGQYYGACGDVYISGTYNTPVTIAADNDIIVTGSFLNATDPGGNTSPSGSATAGLVADQYVRVKHGGGQCSQTTSPNVTIDAAILTLQHSFFVDNYNCGPVGTLTVHGAIAQYFRGIVGTASPTGYSKKYIYDDRLGIILPPYLFDIQNTQWKVMRETLCSPTAPSTSTSSCGYTGP